MTRFFRQVSVVMVLAAVVLMGVARGASQRGKLEKLPEEWRAWLEEVVYPIISDQERDAFLELESDAQRKEFVERLWLLWGQEMGLGSLFRSLYEERLDLCRSEYGSTTEDRARVLLLHGPPDVRKEIDCTEIFHPLEMWMWERLEGVGQDVVVLFYKPYGVGQFRLWDPFESRGVLYTISGSEALKRPVLSSWDRPERRCGDVEEILRWLSLAEYWGRDIKAKQAMQHRQAPVMGKDGSESDSSRFLQFSTIVPKGAKELKFDLSQQVTGRRGGKVTVVFTAQVGREGLGTVEIGDVNAVQLDVTGEVSRDGSMVDRFRYAFTFPADAQVLPVLVERELRPGRYQVRFKVQDNNSSLAGLQESELEVDVPQVTVEPVDTVAETTVDQVAKSNEPTLMLRGPEGEGVSGVQRFSAIAGPKVERVEFFLDGRSVLAKNRPPFEVDLDLGPLPRLASVVAVAHDGAGKELDRQQLDVNIGRERFFVRLQPVAKADFDGGKVHAVATVNVPSDRKLQRVELYWNDLLLVTHYQEPFDSWLPLEDPDAVGYLRALAVLEDGGQAEDVQFVNAPQFISGVLVSAVHLPVTVLDKEKKPVGGLTQEDFEVLEDGIPQTITHFALQQELPVRLGLVIDTSGSMEKTLVEVQRVVFGFLREFLQPRDRAFIIAFSDKPALIQGFTDDFKALERALISLRADRSTALNDAVVYGLFQFSGVRGRKALIVLSDGEDNSSRIDYQRSLDYALRSGVCTYTIGIDLPLTQIRTRSQLSKLARETGGESFFLARDASLEPVYGQINRELRSQYLIVYTSSSEASTDVFRKVEVRVKRPDVDVRTIAGFYPEG